MNENEGQAQPDAGATPEETGGAAPEVSASPEVEDSPFTVDDEEVQSLTPEQLLEKARNYDKGWTQKTQELAKLKKQYESLGDVEQALEAVTVLRTLATDPQARLELFEGLYQEIAKARETGLEFEHPAFAGSQAAPSTETPAAGDSSLEQAIAALDPDNPSDQILRALYEDRIAEKKAREEEKAASLAAQQQAEQQRVLQELENQESQIRAKFTDISDDEIDVVWQLAAAGETDLNQAHQLLEKVWQARAAALFNKRTGEPAPPPSSSGAAQEVPGRQSLEDVFKAYGERANALLAGANQ